MRAERAFTKKYLKVGDVERIYGGLFLQLVVEYEATIEQFMLGLMVRPGGVRSGDEKVRSRFTVRSYKHAADLCAGAGREYSDWLDKRRVRDTAKLVLRDGRPIPDENDVAWSYVHKAKLIRNAIAHAGKAARSKFESKVVAGTPLPPRELKPAGFLRGIFAAGSPPQTRWELYAAELDRFVTSTVK